MLNALNMRILLVILAAILAIASAVAYHRHEIAKAAQSREKRQYELLLQRLENDKKHNSAAANKSKAWQKYLP